MIDPALVATWEAVRLYLNAARAAIPDVPATVNARREYDECIEHNELGLARNVLAELGLRVLDSLPEFWGHELPFWDNYRAASKLMRSAAQPVVDDDSDQPPE
jgi:hypothetical protein